MSEVPYHLRGDVVQKELQGPIIQLHELVKERLRRSKERATGYHSPDRDID